MSMILKSYSQQQLEPSIQINTTSWVYGQSTSVNITVTLGEAQKPYTGTVNLQYTNGISGPSSVQIDNGTGTVSINRTGVNDATITITVPKSANIAEASAQFIGTVSGQNIYEQGATYWYHYTRENCSETGDAGNISCTTRHRTILYWGGSSIYKRDPSNSRFTQITIGNVTYYRGDLIDSHRTSGDYGSYTLSQYYSIRKA